MNIAHFCCACKVPIIGGLCERCGRPAGSPKVPLKISPVFNEELQMLSEVTGEPIDEFNSLELWTVNRYYYYEGKRIFRVTGGNFIEHPKIEWLQNKRRVFKRLKESEKIDEEEYCERVKKANCFALGTLEEKSVRFVRETVNKFRDQIAYKAISFSGGKDSALVSYLVRKALGSNGILHIFSDTTLENSDTLNYVKDFEENERIFLLKTEPQQGFVKLVKKALLPSRIHRWCCTALKTAPIERLLKQILEPGVKVLMFEGTRHEESLRRRKYEPLELNSKIALQIIARPIIEWATLEEWLYILSKQIPINDSYRYGMRRVGCSLCPLNSGWSEYILKSHYFSLARDYINLLYDLARPRNIQVNITDYIAHGQWKTRAGGSVEHRYSVLAEISSWEEDYKFTRIGLSKTVEIIVLREYLKPLSKKYKFKSFESQIGVKTILLLSKEHKVICKIVIEGEFLYIWWFEDDSKIYRQFLADLKKQLIKYQFCAYCGGCETKCVFQAITIDAENQRYTVNTYRCIGCGECISINGIGCLLAKSVKTTIPYKIMKEVANG